jgi:hypothetical protein
VRRVRYLRHGRRDETVAVGRSIERSSPFVERDWRPAMPATQAAGPRGGRTSDEQRRGAARRPVHSGGVARLIGVALLLAAGPACAAPAAHRVGPPPGDHALTLAVDGRDRSYTLHIPSRYRGDAPVPLVLVLHGGGGDAETAAIMSGMSRKSDAEGFVAAYPEGTVGPGGARTWNAGEA